MPEQLRYEDIYRSAIKQLKSYVKPLTRGAQYKKSVKAILADIQAAPQENLLQFLILNLKAINPLDPKLQKIMRFITDSLIEAATLEDALRHHHNEVGSLLRAISALEPKEQAQALLKTSKHNAGWNTLMIAVCVCQNALPPLLVIISGLEPKEQAQVFLQTTRNPRNTLNGLSPLMLAAWRSPSSVIPLLNAIRTLPLEQQINILMQTNREGYTALEFSQHNEEAYEALEEIYLEYHLLDLAPNPQNNRISFGDHRSLSNNGASSSNANAFFHHNEANKRENDELDDFIDESFDEIRCPITRVVMMDPVLLPDGFTYERAAIEKHLENKNTSPMTNEVLPLSCKLLPNRNLKITIERYKEQARKENAIEEGESSTSSQSAPVTTPRAGC